MEGSGKEKKKWKWSLDVRNTPCAREALMYGIGSGLLVAAAYFAKTSIVRRSCDLGVASFTVVSIVSWEVCRWQRAKQRAEVQKTVDMLNNAAKEKKAKIERT